MRFIKVLQSRNTQVAVFKVTENNIPMVLFMTVINGSKYEGVRKFDSTTAQENYFDAAGYAHSQHLDFLNDCEKAIAALKSQGIIEIGGGGKTIAGNAGKIFKA